MFRVGQKVVCVLADPFGLGWKLGPWSPGEELARGKVYTVAAITIDEDNDTIIQLQEVKRVYRWGYNALRFRPVVECKTDISALQALLAPGAKIRESADA